jgi:integrase
MKAAHLHGITVHSLRRTYAYLLKTQGVHVTTAQRLLGHSDPVLTMKIYTGVLDSEIDDVGEHLRKVRLASSNYGVIIPKPSAESKGEKVEESFDSWE